jgi:hypothetical protein
MPCSPAPHCSCSSLACCWAPRSCSEAYGERRPPASPAARRARAGPAAGERPRRVDETVHAGARAAGRRRANGARRSGAPARLLARARGGLRARPRSSR